MTSPRRLRIGLIGLGRLGQVYARDLAARIPETRLVAVADPAAGVASAAAEAYDVARWSTDSQAVIDDPDVDAVVIVSPTHTHRDLVVAAAERGKTIFCEKPPALSLDETRAMKDALARSGVFFQMGFMRRFDAGYAAAKKRLTEGAIGTAVLFKSTSRDPYRTTLEYADPRSSGGMILDMGIHDFDLARFFMGEVRTVHAIGGTLAYPELNSVGDLDNAVVSLVFADGRLGMVDLSRNGIYGYDISTELLGTEGTLRIGYLRETPLYVMKKNQIAHDTVPHFMERFAGAYTAQLQDFAQNVLQGRPAPVTIEDGLAALRIAVAARESQRTGRPVDVSSA
ncbi:MAG TPA: inositol 2-dehydrogenase [Vicinamibacteria bacterium]|nr:inositol 2-dehydrogenase [Vicinamibacteria bacterium]